MTVQNATLPAAGTISRAPGVAPSLLADSQVMTAFLPGRS